MIHHPSCPARHGLGLCDCPASEGNTMTSEELARKAILAMVKFMAIKWTIIIVVTKVMKRAAKKAAT